MSPKMGIKVIGEKSLQLAAAPDLLAYCPSMELLALTSADHQIAVYRLNGQRVFGGTQKKGGPLNVIKIAWKPNGLLLATAWNDGVVRLVDAETNKTVHKISITKNGGDITCIAWESNLTGMKSNRARIPEAGLSWGKVIEEKLEKGQNGHSLDLPRDLTLIDIESSMPKLSILPAAGTMEDIFSSRASLDGLFRAFDPKDNDAADVMIVGTSDGSINLSIYDSFVIGSFPSPLKAPKCQLVSHASHRSYSTHALFLTPVSSLVGGLYFVPMDLRFVSASSSYLSLLASRSTALENLLRYMNQVRVLMMTEWQAVQELPSKFLRNINATLMQENNGNDIVKEMYHSVVTGHANPVVKEWLVDELTERGHKRWDKAVTTGLENLRKLVHEDMLPALERCSVILSRLLGIAKYQGSNDSVGFSSSQINLVMDTVLCLNLISSRILTYTVDEIDLFAAFSVWLRYEIDRLASETASSPSDDNAEKEAAIDHSKVLRYIQTMMNTSRLDAFFQSVEHDQQNPQDSLQSTSQISEEVNAQLQLHERRKLYDRSLLSLELLSNRLDRQSNAVFQQIAEAEKRNVRFGDAVFIASEYKIGPMAVRICPKGEAHFEVNLALDLEKQGKRLLGIHSIGIRIENGISSVVSKREVLISFDSADLKDLAFLDDTTLLVLQDHRQGQPRTLLAVHFADVLAKFTQQSSSSKTSLEDIGALCETYAFPPDASFVPRKMEVTWRQDEGLGSARLCVLGEDMLRYKVFTFEVGDGEVVAREDAEMS